MSNWPVSLNDITRLQLEITSFCNAECPSCERHNYFTDLSNPYSRQLNQNYITIQNFKRWINHDFQNLQRIHFCGNIDEPTLNPDLLEMCEYINLKYPNVEIWIATNGGTKTEKFWKKLAEYNTTVVFGIDGLMDTNHIYRKNVNWSKLEKNYRTYINCGGKAIWQFIVFEHNKHQLSQARKLSKSENFYAFNKKYSGRDNSEVIEIKKTHSEKKRIKCKVTYFNDELEKSFFIDVNGTVWPCCWMGTSLHTQKFYETIGSKFEHVLENNLKYISFEEIVNGEMFSYLWNNLSNMEICNSKCKKNEIDEDNWKVN
jgi:MoaA/NifB/PqqE/SkfB family radical SAM enzyme